MDILQANTHGANGDGKILEAGEKVEKVMGGEGKFGGLDTLRRKLQSAKGQGCGQSGRGRGEGGTPRGRGRGDMGGLGIFGRLASQLKSIGEGLFMGTDETGEILARDQQLV